MPPPPIKARRYRPGPADLEWVRSYLDNCEIAWQETVSDGKALELEAATKQEWLPHLTKV